MYAAEPDSDLMPCRETQLEEANVRLRIANEQLRTANYELALELSRVRGECLAYEHALGLDRKGVAA